MLIFFKTGTLDTLISLSEDLPKQDAFFTATVAKTVETLRNLLNNDPSKLSQHILVDERTVDDYLLRDWKWNEGRYGVQRGLREMVEEMSSIDNVMKAKLNTYNLAKGSLLQMQRKKTYIVREFVYSAEELEKQKDELETADSTEKELWTELLRLARTNFSESFQILVHLKVVRLFGESVLRYGLPAHYTGLFIKPEPKATKRTLTTLQQQFTYLSRRTNPTASKSKSKAAASTGGDDVGGEYQTLLEEEYFDFVLFEVPWIV
ncbi:hypothetical protein EUX98_g7171 [Antrodiella citrinella]|uniref:V-type proton ATPase subunit C n=1 Tax=Antrodiella citrinella TaxID=2447956 RepID=A0A4S4MM83_9APHY|nr:hypothetical protein EUX98_g7171 [Antrodiella citrinella]